jgi:hypothetical protein
MKLKRLWPVRRHDLFGLGGWGPGPPRRVERCDSAETAPTPQAKSPGRPENHRRALAGRTAAVSGKSARLMPGSLPPATPPSSRGSWPRANRIKSDALAAGGHAGPERIARSREGWSVRPGTSHRSITPQSNHPNPINQNDLNSLTEQCLFVGCPDGISGLAPGADLGANA